MDFIQFNIDKTKNDLSKEQKAFVEAFENLYKESKNKYSKTYDDIFKTKTAQSFFEYFKLTPSEESNEEIIPLAKSEFGENKVFVNLVDSWNHDGCKEIDEFKLSDFFENISFSRLIIGGEERFILTRKEREKQWNELLLRQSRYCCQKYLGFIILEDMKKHLIVDVYFLPPQEKMQFDPPSDFVTIIVPKERVATMHQLLLDINKVGYTSDLEFASLKEAKRYYFK